MLTPDSGKPPDTDGDSGVWLLVTSCSMAELMIQQILSKATVIFSEHMLRFYILGNQPMEKSIDQNCRMKTQIHASF